MDLERQRRLNELLVQAFERPQPDRRAFIAQACSDDQNLLEEALNLLGREPAVGDFLEESILAKGGSKGGAKDGPKGGPKVRTKHGPKGGSGSGKAKPVFVATTVLARPNRLPRRPKPPDSEVDDSRLQSESRSQIGPFRLVRLLGEGGMGRVYLAEQTKPVRRLVALKVIGSSFESTEVQARFDAERQAMARLAHPNVGQMWEAGTTEDGFPYFAMEHVSGEPITDYCDQRELSIPDRLRIFISVCQGVHHAHQKQIVHRDLKPSNILVTELDERPVPKIIDFGIAKALDQPLTELSLSTGSRVIGTPAYMSPEALRILPSAGVEAGPRPSDDVDTRTDIYALGILLYELLTGSRPFETQVLNLPRVLRRIVEEDPPLPSQRLSTVAVATQELAARRRRLEPPALRRRLEGDLDWIVMKAIAKERDDRYGSAAELADDVIRYLRHEPIRARPASLGYQAGKLMRRHRGVVAIAATIVFAVAAGILLTALALVQARDAEARALAEQERARAAAAEMREVNDFLVGVLEEPSSRAELDRAAERARALDSRPQVQARLLARFGEAYLRLGLDARGEPLLRQALEAFEADLGADSPEAVRIRSHLARLAADSPTPGAEP